MGTEKSEGLEVVAWEVEYPDAREVTYAKDLASFRRSHQGFPIYPLVRLSDAQAEVARAREEWWAKGVEQARALCWAIKEGRPAEYRRGCDACATVIDRMLETLPTPPPGHEGGA